MWKRMIKSLGRSREQECSLGVEEGRKKLGQRLPGEERFPEEVRLTHGQYRVERERLPSLGRSQQMEDSV